MSTVMKRAQELVKDKHPWQLIPMFMTEFGERFGYYLVMALLYLFATDKNGGGLGYEPDKASLIVGTFAALVYFVPFIGGLIADRILGYRRSIVIGATLMAIGYFTLYFPQEWLFYCGLGIMTVGNGFFKSNMSTLFGKMYPDKSPIKEDGYKILYLAVNSGSFFSPLVAAVLRNLYGWHVAFAGAGVGMTIALIIFLFVYRHMGQFDTIASKEEREVEGEVKLSLLGKYVLPVSLGLAVAGYFIQGVNLGFVLACIPVMVFFGWIVHKSHETERGGLITLLILIGFAIPYFAIYSLNATSLTDWAKLNTDRDLGNGTVHKVAASLYQLEDAPADSEYFDNVAPEADRPLPGESKKVLNPEFFQVVNPFFIMFLTPIFIGILKRVKKKWNYELSLPKKIAIGMVFAGASMFVMLPAVSLSGAGAVKVSMLWLFLTYLMITAGELFISPVGQSLVSEMAPKRMVAVMMGGFYLSISIGFKLGGMVSELATKISPYVFFTSLGVVAVAIGVAALLLEKRINTFLPKPKEEKE